MKRSHLVFGGLVAATFFAIQLETVASGSGLLRYSWSGFIIPEGSDDPLQIGAAGLPFEVTVGVPREAHDLFDGNIELAAYEADYASIVLGEQLMSFSGDGLIDFTDRDDFDLLIFQGVFDPLGDAVDIGFTVALLADTVAFSQLVEPPPFFEPTRTAARGSFNGPGPYAAIVDAGTLVTVVPEPTTIALLAIGVLFCPLVRKPKGGRRKTRRNNV